MKVITENNVKNFILDKICKVYIGFDDNIEVKLDSIIDYDLDLDKIECSTIGFTNMFNNVEIENHFRRNRRNHIIYVNIEAVGYIMDQNKYIKVYYDIPCDMSIRNLKISGEQDSVGNMYVELEGFVK